MKNNRPKEKSYITILLDSDELKARAIVKKAHKLPGKTFSDRKIYMAMINALMPAQSMDHTPATIADPYTTPDEATDPTQTPENILTDETVIQEEE